MGALVAHLLVTRESAKFQSFFKKRKNLAYENIRAEKRCVYVTLVDRCPTLLRGEKNRDATHTHNETPGR